MKIAVLGLGYVGCISAACFAQEGHHVIGVDIQQEKIDAINQGESPIVEKGLKEIIFTTVQQGTLQASSDAHHAILESDVTLVCVGTPSQENGSINLNYVEHVARDLGETLQHKQTYHTVLFRSTILPGTSKRTIIPLLEKYSGKKIGSNFGYVFNPEFLREGSSVSDFYDPPFTLIGEINQRSGDVVEQLYTSIQAPFIRTEVKVSEMVKYVCNAYHALKVTFANEIGNICKKLEIDSHEVMNIFTQDDKLNISTSYLKPGFAFGGSCLPKDLRALLYQSRQLDLEVPVLDSIMHSNELQIGHALNMILATHKRKIGIFGLSFKPATDDLRESPAVKLVEMLLGKGMDIKIYDREVSLAKLIGSNKASIEKTIPHISQLLCSSINEVIKSSDVLVIMKKDTEFKKIFELHSTDQFLIDLVRLNRQSDRKTKKYSGLSW